MSISRFNRLDYGRILVLALCYAAAARIAAVHDPVGESFRLLSLPSGIALAALLILWVRHWPGVASGAAVSARIAGLPDGRALYGAVGDTLEPVVPWHCSVYHR